METMREQRVATRARAGCPPVLEVDLVHPDTLGPAVEWPPAPPSRRPEDIDVTDATTISGLTTGRALRMLDATVAHLRTALETSPDDETTDRLQRAIGDVDRARDTLIELGAAN